MCGTQARVLPPLSYLENVPAEIAGLCEMEVDEAALLVDTRTTLDFVVTMTAHLTHRRHDDDLLKEWDVCSNVEDTSNFECNVYNILIAPHTDKCTPLTLT